MIYFTADTYYGYVNTIHTNRPFKNIIDMDNKLIEYYNNIISPEDEVYFIGDFSMKGPENKVYLGRIIKKLKGQKHLILGNHDRLNPFMYIELGFTSVHTSYQLHIPILGYCTLNHDPAIYSLINRNDLLICGHIHTLFKKFKNVINVGVDVWEFKPVSVNQIIKELF